MHLPEVSIPPHITPCKKLGSLLWLLHNKREKCTLTSVNPNQSTSLQSQHKTKGYSNLSSIILGQLSYIFQLLALWVLTQKNWMKKEQGQSRTHVQSTYSILSHVQLWDPPWYSNIAWCGAPLQHDTSTHLWRQEYFLSFSCVLW